MTSRACSLGLDASKQTRQGSCTLQCVSQYLFPCQVLFLHFVSAENAEILLTELGLHCHIMFSQVGYCSTVLCCEIAARRLWQAQKGSFASTSIACPDMEVQEKKFCKAYSQSIPIYIG
jgi:hypothetical protein